MNARPPFPAPTAAPPLPIPTRPTQRRTRQQIQAAIRQAAIVEFSTHGFKGASTQTIAAQAADALLNVQGVASSFVLYPTGGKVKISARSLSGSNNVQMILEPMGGGGNQEIAAALVAAESTQAALKQLCGCIDDYLDQSDQPDEPAPAEPTEP